MCPPGGGPGGGKGPKKMLPRGPPLETSGSQLLAACWRRGPVRAISYAAPGIRGSGGSSASGGGTNLLPGAGLPWRWRGLHRTTAAGSLSPSCIGPLDLAWRALPRQQCRLHHGDLPPTIHHSGVLHYGGLHGSLPPSTMAAGFVSPSCSGPLDPGQILLSGRPDPAEATTVGSIGPDNGLDWAR
jgi:hypothetical protein